MKNLNDKKSYQALDSHSHKIKENDPEVSQMSIGQQADENEKPDGSLEEVDQPKVFKNNSKPRAIGSDNELTIDIYDAIGRDQTLFPVALNILVHVENAVVTLKGTVSSEQEKTTAGDKATALAGHGNVKNRLNVTRNLN